MDGWMDGRRAYFYLQPALARLLCSGNRRRTTKQASNPRNVSLKSSNGYQAREKRGETFKQQQQQLPFFSSPLLTQL